MLALRIEEAMIQRQSIEGFSSEVARAFSPERIILFGSHANGTANQDSDVDILVVMPYEGKSWRMASKIRLRTQPTFPLDLIVRSPQQLRDRIELGDPFLTEVTTTGKVLYDSNSH